MKSTCVSFACPSCDTGYEIFMKKQPDLMIVSCSICKTYVSFYDGQAFSVSKSLLQKIKLAKTDYDVLSIFDDINKYSANTEHLSQDDVLNLKIDLGLCETFDDVMRLVCKSP